MPLLTKIYKQMEEKQLTVEELQEQLENANNELKKLKEKLAWAESKNTEDFRKLCAIKAIAECWKMEHSTRTAIIAQLA